MIRTTLTVAHHRSFVYDYFFFTRIIYALTFGSLIRRHKKNEVLGRGILTSSPQNGYKKVCTFITRIFDKNNSDNVMQELRVHIISACALLFCTNSLNSTSTSNAHIHTNKKRGFTKKKSARKTINNKNNKYYNTKEIKHREGKLDECLELF